MEATTLNIYQKLHKIQLAVKGFGKDKDTSSQYNPKGYKYVTGDKVLEHIKPLMNELGLILKQEILSIDNVRQDYAIKSGQKSEILSKVMMRFTWINIENGEKDENLFGANGQNDWDKGVGSALTYAERYFLLKYFHIATDEDDIDNPNRKPLSKLDQIDESLKILSSITDLTKFFNGLEAADQADKSIAALFTKRKTELTKQTA